MAPFVLSPSCENPGSLVWRGVLLYLERGSFEAELPTSFRPRILESKGQMEGRQAAIMTMPLSRIVQIPSLTEVPIDIS